MLPGSLPTVGQSVGPGAAGPLAFVGALVRTGARAGALGFWARSPALRPKPIAAPTSSRRFIVKPPVRRRASTLPETPRTGGVYTAVAIQVKTTRQPGRPG